MDLVSTLIPVAKGVGHVVKKGAHHVGNHPKKVGDIVNRAHRYRELNGLENFSDAARDIVAQVGHHAADVVSHPVTHKLMHTSMACLTEALHHLPQLKL